MIDELSFVAIALRAKVEEAPGPAAEFLHLEHFAQKLLCLSLFSVIHPLEVMREEHVDLYLIFVNGGILVDFALVQLLEIRQIFTDLVLFLRECANYAQLRINLRIGQTWVEILRQTALV